MATGGKRYPLGDSEKLLRTVVSNLPVVLWAVDEDGVFVMSEGKGLDALGLQPGEVVGRSAFEVYAEVPEIVCNIRRALAGETFTAQVRVGDRVYETRYAPAEDEEGHIKGVIGVSHDVNERARAEEALRRSEERYRELFDNAVDIVYTHDLSGRYLSVNRAAERITGYTREEAIGKSVAEVVAPEHLQLAAEMTRRKLQGGGDTTYELDIITKDRRRVPVEVSTRIVYEDGRPVAVQGIARDISARRQAEERLRRQEAVLTGLSYAARQFLSQGIEDPEGINDVLKVLGQAAEVDRAYIFENQVGADGELLGCQRFEWAAPGVEPQIDNPDLAAFPYVKGGFGRWVEVMSRGEVIKGHVRDFPESEQEVLAAQGILSILCVPVFVGGRWWGFLGCDQCSREREWSDASVDALRTAADLLGAAIYRQRAELALRASEEKYRELVENSNEVIYTLDRTGVITYVSPSVEQVGGIKPEDVIGTSFVPLIHPDDLPGLMESFQRTLAGHLEPSEYRLRTASGEYRWVRSHSKPIPEGGEVVGLRGMLVDITERRRAEEALRMVAGGTASATGPEFFRSLVRHLAAAVGTKYALVGELLCDGSGQAHTLAVWAGEDYGENFTYQLEGTACEQALRGGMVFYAQGIRELFPEDALAAKMGVESYLGTALLDSKGEALGILVVMDDKPMLEAPRAENVISIFAARAGAELERQRADDLLREERQLLERIAGGVPLERVLEDVIRMVERRSDGLRGSVLLVDESGTRLVPGPAPSLPKAYTEGLASGVPIGPNSGSCGTAAFRREPVVVTDIATDPLWVDYRELALSHGLRACWSTPIISADGQVLGTFALYYDEPRAPDTCASSIIDTAVHLAGIAIERERAQTALRASEERYRSVVNAARDVIYTLGPDGALTSLNPAFEAITGWSPSDCLGKFFGPLVHPDDLPTALNLFRRVMNGEPVSYELRILTKGGDYVVGEFTSTPLFKDGKVAGVLGIARDITERKKAEETIRRLAYHDALTGLPNRALFEDRLRLALAQAHRSQQMLAVMFLDLDRFKLVNDTLGHGHGDLLLQSVAKDLTELVREGDTVGRVGGDEFTILLPDIESVDAATSVAERILERLKQPRIIDGHEFRVTTSIGITTYPADGSDPETLLRNADTAMYQAKERGRDSYVCFTAAMNASALRRLTLERDLRVALESGQFELHYQPLAELATGRIAGCEALLRWRDPERGLILPEEFIELAEETGIIVPLGEWVLHQACAQNKAWQEAGFAPMRVAVNLSVRQLQDRCLVETVRQVLEETGLDPTCLQLEITEGAVMTDMEPIIEVLQQVRKLGVGIAVDDFGTGYSSLSYLKRFPIDAVKIDRSFVRDLTVDANDAALVTTIIAMARSLGLKVIAEGVETRQQLAFLRERGCDEYQGFLLSRPVPAPVFEKFLVRKGGRDGRSGAKVPAARAR